MTRMNTLSLAALLALAVSPAFAHDEHHHHHHDAGASSMDSERPAPLSGESLYNIDAPWTDQDGKPAKLSDLRGHPTVVAMLYTSCQAACPLIVSDLKRIEEGLSDAAKGKTRFAVFSFDTTRDTPSKLKEFAKTHGLDPGRWRLFHGKQASVRKLAAALGIRFKKQKSGDFDHSNVITILDSDGVIAHQQVGLRQDPKESISKLSN